MTDDFWLRWMKSRTPQRESMIENLPLIKKKSIDFKLINMYLEDLFFTSIAKFKADLIKDMNEKNVEEPAKSQIMKIIGV
ncbi:MAG: hypothetical protein DRN81_02125 [Thermoproteota archaeon]|nr:MAG: hypothetical protein DRN81_02125 [Candidatus Korarchaeota archaeon]